MANNNQKAANAAEKETKVVVTADEFWASLGINPEEIIKHVFGDFSEICKEAAEEYRRNNKK
jgi:hypothetical protein